MIPDILPVYSDVVMNINEGDIKQHIDTLSTAISFVEPIQQSYPRPTIFNYVYNHIYQILASNNNKYAFKITQNGYNNVPTGSFTRDLYTSNVIQTFLGIGGTTGEYDSIYSHVNVDNITNKGIYSYTYNNYVVTSNVLFYNKNEEYQLNIVADVMKYYNYSGEVSGPSTIIDLNASNMYTYHISGSNTEKTFDIEVYTKFLNTVPYGAYDGFSFESNIIRKALNTSSFNDETILFGSNFKYNINLYDVYSVYDFNIDDNYRSFYMVTKSLDYQPHIIMKNHFSDNDAFKVYHQGFEQQAKKWPINPLDEIIKSIKAKYILIEFMIQL
jgi:hypothetical protein